MVPRRKKIQSNDVTLWDHEHTYDVTVWDNEHLYDVILGTMNCIYFCINLQNHANCNMTKRFKKVALKVKPSNLNQ